MGSFGFRALSMSVLALIIAVGVVACHDRYKPGTPTIAKFAYEIDTAATDLNKMHSDLVAAVDSHATTPQAANRFLKPAADAARLAKEKIFPLMEQYQAAVAAADAVKQNGLHADLTPLLTQFNQLVKTAFSAGLPDNVIGKMADLAARIQGDIVTIRQQWAEVFAQ